MIPDWWTLTLLTLAVCRLLRLAGWDHFPPIVRAREWLIGKTWHYNVVDQRDQPVSKVRRPLLEELIECPFCLGFWLALAVYPLWWWQPHWTIVVCVPLALNEAAGLISKNLDA